MPELTYNIVYKITNLVNNKIYVGVHKTNKLDDGYMGSGTVLKTAIQKHGIKNFNKEILFCFNTYKEALEKEKEIVNEGFLSRKDTYNLRRGGNGGFDFIRKQPEFDKWHQKAIEKGSKNARIVQHQKLLQREQDYYNNPKLCQYCGKPIPYSRRRNNFCNRSCSAKGNPKKKLEYTIKISRLGYLKEEYSHNPKLCLHCNTPIPFSKRRQMFCSKSCKSLKQHKDNPLLRYSNPKGINKKI